MNGNLQIEMMLIDRIKQALEGVFDPEIPVLSILDLGLLRDIQIQGEVVKIFLSPTYSGCPALQTMKMDIRLKMLEIGVQQIEVIEQLSPAWTTDDMSEKGRLKLLEYGISPPIHSGLLKGGSQRDFVICPLCKSKDVKVLSMFSSTSCKAMYSCQDCLEPFDVFKCHFN